MIQFITISARDSTEILQSAPCPAVMSSEASTLVVTSQVMILSTIFGHVSSVLIRPTHCVIIVSGQLR